MAETKRRLRIFNLEARGLRVGDSGGSSDPYAILSIDSWKQQTSVQKRTLEPVWVDADYKLDESKINFDKHFTLRIDLKDKVCCDLGAELGHMYANLCRTSLALLSLEPCWFLSRVRSVTTACFVFTT